VHQIQFRLGLCLRLGELTALPKSLARFQRHTSKGGEWKRWGMGEGKGRRRGGRGGEWEEGEGRRGNVRERKGGEMDGGEGIEGRGEDHSASISKLL